MVGNVSDRTDRGIQVGVKLTQKADYALMAIKHLAEQATEGSSSARDMADVYGIPPEGNIGDPLRQVNESIAAVWKRIKISNMREESEEPGALRPRQRNW